MNYQISGYLVYLLLMTIIIVFVGRYFHKNGRIFIVSLFRNNQLLADTVNNLLLVAYYLFNIGYAFATLRTWERITTLDQLIADISLNMGFLILVLSCTHYLNILAIYFYARYKSFLNSKPFQS